MMQQMQAVFQKQVQLSWSCIYYICFFYYHHYHHDYVRYSMAVSVVGGCS